MSLKMCGLLFVVGATHGLIEGIKNRKASCTCMRLLNGTITFNHELGMVKDRLSPD